MAESTTKKPRKSRAKRSKVLQMEPKTPPDTPDLAAGDAAAAEIEPAQASEPYDQEAAAARERLSSTFVSAKPFPLPPRGKGKGGFCEETDGMKYWRSLPPEFLNRTNVYVNRERPVLNRLQELSEEELLKVQRKQKREPAKYIDKPDQPFGEDARMEFLSRYGSGIYKVYINDGGVKGAKDADLQSRNLCKFFVTYYDSDFPTVLDPSRPDKGLGILDLKHPDNESYVADLRMKGVLPRDGKAESDMNTEVVSKLVDKVDTLAGQVAEGKQEKLLDQIRAELRGAAGEKSNGADNVQLKMLELIITCVKPAAPVAPVDTTGPIVALFQGQMARLETQMAEERAERRKVEDALRARANEPPPDPFASFERMVTMFDKVKAAILGSQSTGAGSVAGSVAKQVSKMSGTLEFFSELIPKIADAPILNALAHRIMNPIPGSPAAVAAGNPAPGITPAAGTAPAVTGDELLKFVQTVVTPAMLSYLEADSTGEDFASWVYAGFPEKLVPLQARGPQTIIGMYQNSGAWRRIQPRAAQFVTFVEEFCRWKPDAEEQSAAGPAAAAAPPSPFTNGAPAPIDLDEQLEGPPLEGRMM